MKEFEREWMEGVIWRCIRLPNTCQQAKKSRADDLFFLQIRMFAVIRHCLALHRKDVRHFDAEGFVVALIHVGNDSAA